MNVVGHKRTSTVLKNKENIEPKIQKQQKIEVKPPVVIDLKQLSADYKVRNFFEKVLNELSKVSIGSQVKIELGSEKALKLLDFKFSKMNK